MYFGRLGRTCDPATQFFNTEADAWWDDTSMCTPSLAAGGSYGNGKVDASAGVIANPPCGTPYYKYLNPDGSIYYYDNSGTICTPAALGASSTSLMIGFIIMIFAMLMMDAGGSRRRR